MASKVETDVFELVKPFAEQFGLELIEVEYAKKVDGMNLTIYIDKEGGVMIDDCEKLHKAIDEPLDELNPTNDASYTLNVSSQGLDWPLKTDRDFNKSKGKEITVKLYTKDKDGKKKFDGVLEDFDEKTFTMDINGIKKIFEREKVAHV
ncbi:MAG: ribosome maturation factor RimP, partial [Clostridia bacterium]